MAKIPEAQNRLFKNVFVCKNCKTKKKADIQSKIEMHRKHLFRESELTYFLNSKESEIKTLNERI